MRTIFASLSLALVSLPLPLAAAEPLAVRCGTLLDPGSRDVEGEHGDFLRRRKGDARRFLERRRRAPALFTF